jgi:hypothetical protein
MDSATVRHGPNSFVGCPPVAASLRAIGISRLLELIQGFSGQALNEKARGQLRKLAKRDGIPTDIPNALLKCGALFLVGRLSQILMEAITEIQTTWVVFKN